MDAGGRLIMVDRTNRYRQLVDIGAQAAMLARMMHARRRTLIPKKTTWQARQPGDLLHVSRSTHRIDDFVKSIHQLLVEIVIFTGVLAVIQHQST